MKNVVVVDGLRTPFGRLGGGLRQFHNVDMAAMVIKVLMEKTGLDPKELDAVYYGTANGDAKCPNPARFAALQAGLPYETSAVAVEMQCGSAIACINHAAYRIQAGDADVLLVGGGETFSQRFAKFSTSVEPYKMIAPAAIPPSLAPKAEDNLIMLQVSDLMAQKWGVSREEADEFAFRSQMLAKEAMVSGFLNPQLMPVVIPATKKTPEITVALDEHPRPTTTLEALAKLRPVYEGGVTTAGNASGRNDGASFLLMMSEEKAKELGYKPLARYITGADVGCDPKLMGIGPAYSNLKVLKKWG
jgi:acetyl-CoA C-acetyltransferase